MSIRTRLPSRSLGTPVGSPERALVDVARGASDGIPLLFVLAMVLGLAMAAWA